MNTARLADLYRQRAATVRALADVDDAIAAELSGPPAPAPHPTPPRRRGRPVPVAPLEPPSEVDRARARRELARVGAVAGKPT